ncbi:hypothetical protein SCHPADRAFT_947214 [Schizopora paradoxa]|uniref:Uncharacterized protein n=1 Tax=Schizopora paradoxa TaxID=27342 RepID=A0A0H2QZW9_9AGAM|nr:hypothetical protein SCHPADRAFT_947214 [Schizopora paradoxa]
MPPRRAAAIQAVKNMSGPGPVAAGKGKGTARKSTGGTAPKMTLKRALLPVDPLDVDMKEDNPGSLDVSFHDQACFLCRGGGYLACCSTCMRSVCYESCLASLVPSELEEINTKDTYFKCPACHDDTDREKSKKEKKKKVVLTPYYGFYLSASNAPLFNGPLLLGPGSFTTARWREDTSPLLVFHFHLPSLFDKGSAPRVVHERLLANYLESTGKHATNHEITYQDCTFDLNQDNNPNVVDMHGKHVENLVKLMEESRINFKRALIFISTHSNDNTGGLYASEEWSSEITEFFECVITTKFLRYIAPLESTFFFLSCGSTVNSPSVMSEMESMVQKYHINNLFLFDAKALVRDFCTPFIEAYAGSVMLHGFSVSAALTMILQNSQYLGMHAHIVRLSLENGAVLKETMVFIHPSLKPAGNLIPTQCWDCARIRSWDVKVNPDNELEATLKCTGEGCGVEKSLTFPFILDKKMDHTKHQIGRNGKWLVIKGEVQKRKEKNI